MIKELFKQKFPNSIVQSRQTMHNLAKKFHDTSSVLDSQRSGRPKTATSTENIDWEDEWSDHLGLQTEPPAISRCGALWKKTFITRPTNLTELKERIREQFILLRNDPYLLQRICRSVYGRCRMCIEERGGHFEHLI